MLAQLWLLPAVVVALTGCFVLAENHQGSTAVEQAKRFEPSIGTCIRLCPNLNVSLLNGLLVVAVSSGGVQSVPGGETICSYTFFDEAIVRALRPLCFHTQTLTSPLNPITGGRCHQHLHLRSGRYSHRSHALARLLVPCRSGLVARLQPPAPAQRDASSEGRPRAPVEGSSSSSLIAVSKVCHLRPSCLSSERILTGASFHSICSGTVGTGGVRGVENVRTDGGEEGGRAAMFSRGGGEFLRDMTLAGENLSRSSYREARHAR